MTHGIPSRPPEPAELVDGVPPVAVVEPQSAEQLAAVLADAASSRQTVVVSGGSTKLDWGETPSRVDLLVRTGRLNRLVAHRHGDLTATVEAGMTLGALNAELARYGQWLPVESAFEDATVGGLVATNDAGFSRHRCGTPRDLLIGATLALTDGRLVTSGGHVVKNVAGYDLGRLVSGSHGTLGALTEATFKLLPLPQATATVEVLCADVDAVGRHVAAIGASQLDPIAVDVGAEWPARAGQPAYRVVVRFASSPRAVEAQVEATRVLAGGEEVDSGREAALWHEGLRGPWVGHATVVRLAWLPADVAHVMGVLARAAEPSGVRLSFLGHAGVGSGLVTLRGDVDVQAGIIASLRATPRIGNVAVLRGSRELKRAVGVWGPQPSAVAALGALKRMFDPAGIMNAGRGPV